MTFKDAIERAEARFSNGCFSLLLEEDINKVVIREKVPNARGVYVIFGDDLQHPLYIGKAGTIRANGTWKDQGLRRRLTRKQNRIYRRDFFRSLMGDKGLTNLTFLWFVTHHNNSGAIPAFAEMELLQAHYDEYGFLPELNKCV